MLIYFRLVVFLRAALLTVRQISFSAFSNFILEKWKLGKHLGDPEKLPDVVLVRLVTHMTEAALQIEVSIPQSETRSKSYC